MGSGERWLRFVSKGVIVVPIILLILSLAFLLPGKSIRDTLIKPSPTPTPQLKIENINLNGEYVCRADNWEGYIKKGKIYIKNIGKQQSFYLYRDDCLYSWKGKEYSGSKVCGLSPYISIFENLSRLKLLNLDIVISSFLPNTDNDEASKKIGKVLQSCRIGSVKNNAIFELPKNVLFKNQKLGI